MISTLRRLPVTLGAALGLSIVSLGAWCGAVESRLDLLAHFRVHLTIAATLIAVVALTRGNRAAAWIGLAAVVANGVAIADRFRGSEHRESSGEALRVMMFNVNVGNPRKEELARWIVETESDLVVIQEATDDLCGRIDGTGRYRTVIADLRPGEHAKRSSALHCRVDSGISIERAEVVRVDRSPLGLGMLVATLRRGAESFTVFVPRLPTPILADRRAIRQTILADLAQRVRSCAIPRLVVADLNTTPFAADFRALLRDSGLRDGADGYGVCGTWPADGFGSWLPIPIDHVLHSAEFAVTHYEVVSDACGSDHHPVRVEFERVDAPSR